MRRLTVICAWFVVCMHEDARAQACEPAKTALVLSGGGAKGFAHIGVIEVLDSLGIKPNLIVGSSVGAIIGAMYASGYTGKQIDSIMTALPFDQLIHKYEPSVSASLGLLRPLAVWELGRTGYALSTGAVSEGEVNAFISSLTLHGNLIARGQFDSLPIPFRAVATDIATNEPVILATGDLARAVRASAALPVVFRAVHLPSQWLIDGGLADNTPVGVARGLGAERVWVSLLPYAPPDPNSYDDPLALSAALVNSLFHEDSIRPRAGDVVINNPTREFGNLDFHRKTSDALKAIGRASARAAFGAAKCVRPLVNRTPRTMPTHIVSVRPEGTDRDAESVISDLGLAPGAELDVAQMQGTIRRLGASERYRGIWLSPEGAGPNISFRPELESAADRAFGVGVAFDEFMSGRLWLGGIDRSFFGGHAEGSVLSRLGTYEQDVSGFIRKRAHVRRSYLPITASAKFTHEAVRLFSRNGELPSAETQEVATFLGLRDDPSPGTWRYSAGIDARLWREPTRNTRGTFGLRASLFRARTEYEMGTIVEGLALQDFQRARIDASDAFGPAASFVRFRLRAGWGNRLPIQQTFTLGGDDGFAGMRLGDIRGTQEAFASVLFKRRIVGSLSGRIEGMTGAVGSGYGFLVRNDSTYFGKIYTGVRAGLEVDSPLGPIRVEEGVNNDHSRALLFRVGYWF